MVAVSISRAWGRQAPTALTCVPGAREIDTATNAEAALFADSRESVRNEAGDYLLAEQEGAANPIRAELGDQIIGAAQGRADDEEITLFESLGLAAEDLAAASYLYQEATRLGAGTSADF
jgi:ornithine cyclodeaminase/alanine dehydrogenase-like protein (mu-crystallin family)